MKLYAVRLSPFAARVRLALRLKNINCALVPPAGGSTRSPEYLAINPIGKLPVLVTDDGLVIPESEAIIDYLEARFPDPALTPKAPEQRIRMNVLIRTLELYVTPAMFRLFGQMDPASRDPLRCAAELQQWRAGLTLVDQFIDPNASFAAGPHPDKADCILLPTLLLCEVTGESFELAGILDSYPHLVAYRTRALQHKDMEAIWRETREAIEQWRGTGH